jgi:hypothetical protein
VHLASAVQTRHKVIALYAAVGQSFFGSAFEAKGNDNGMKRRSFVSDFDGKSRSESLGVDVGD